MATKKELVERLSQVPLFHRCTMRDLRTVARHLETASVLAGQTIVSEGEHGETFFLVLDGTLSVEAVGQETVLLGPGQHFGELALLDPGPRSATVASVSDVELAILGVRMFRVLLRDMPQISSGMMASLASQLRTARLGS